MKKIILGCLLFLNFSSFGQYRKDQLTSLNSREIKAYGSYSSFRLGKVIDSLILSLESQKRAAGYIPVGNASGIAVDVPASGDVTLSSAGAFSVTKLLGNTIPVNASGALVNNGSGSLSWTTVASTFQSLTDGPGSFSGKTLNYSRVNAGETALEYRTPTQVRSDIGAGTGNGSVTSIATTSPITGGTITTTGTIACATCVTSAASLTSNSLVIGGGSQATSTTTTGTGVLTALGVNTGSSGAFVVNGGSIVSATTGVTQSANDNSTKLATTAYADAAAAATGTATPTASTISKWDANKNFSAAGFIPAYTTTATAAGTTTLTVGSNQNQYFTGTTTQTVTLPVTSTLVLGQQFFITNNSTGVVTVNSSGANLVVSMAGSSAATLTCILTSGTTAASWNVSYSPASPFTTVGSLLVAGTGLAPSELLASTSGYNLTSNGAAAAPTYQAQTSNNVVATNTNDAATAGNIGQTITGTGVTTYTNFTSSATYKNISSIALTAGNWIINATFTLYGNAATVTTSADAIFVVSTTTASATGAVEGKSIFYMPQNLFVTSTSAHVTGTITFEVKLSGSQTYYLNGQATYSAGNMQYVGSIEATRPR